MERTLGRTGWVLGIAVFALASCGKDVGKAARKAQTAEAREFVTKIYLGARSYYMDPEIAMNYGGGSLFAPMFPEPSVGPTPPLGECCKQGGKCSPNSALWQTPTWTALQFAIDDPHYYSYEYQVSGNATADSSAQVDGSNNFTVLAYGDLDCDGEYSTFSMFGEINEVYSDGPPRTAAMARFDELE